MRGSTDSRNQRAGHSAILVVVAAALLVSCGGSDPKARILKERARWDVEVLSWAMDEAGQMSVFLQVSGPPSSSLEKLTIRIALLGAGDERLSEEWRTLDLARVPRGAPTEIPIKIDSAGRPVEGLAVDQVLAPTSEEETRIEELQLGGG